MELKYVFSMMMLEALDLSIMISENVWRRMELPAVYSIRLFQYYRYL